MKTIYLFIMLLCLPFVMADEYHDDEIMDIDTFVQLNYSVLGDFNLTLNNITTNSNNYVYGYEMNVYVDYWYEYYDDPDDWETIKVHRVIPTRMKFEWYCYETYNCNTIWSEYIYDYALWWMGYYVALINDYS